MTLTELSVDYRAHADALRERMEELQALRLLEEDATQQLLLDDRIRMLGTMWREARDLAVLTARYYERGYRRNGKYTL